MRVYIVRHGKAEDAPSLPIRRQAEGIERSEDFRRELMPRGVAQAEFLASRMSKVGAPPERILSSRYPRAIETATPINSALACDVRTEFGLEVDHPVDEALALIDREMQSGVRSFMLVGHNPQLGELLAVLASGLAPQQMILRTGELVAVEFRSGNMIGGAKIIGRLRQCPDTKDESIVDGVFLSLK